MDLNLEDDAVKYFNETLLREELRVFLEASGLPTEICTDNDKWRRFRKKLAGVIEDAPLELRASNKLTPTHFIKSLVVKNKSTDEALNVEWKFACHSNPVVEVKGGKMKLIGKAPANP